jgi:sugar-specific transcriptional regulator TrmB
MTILINENGIKIFQLSKREIRVLTILYHNGPMMLSETVRASKIPRATLYPIIQKLKERGFIRRQGSTSQIHWSIEPEDNIKEILQNFIDSEPSEPPHSPSSPGYQP